MKNTQLNKDYCLDYSNVSREVRVVEYENDIVKPKWIADLVPPKKEVELKLMAEQYESPFVIVKDPVTNHYFKVRENQLTYDVKGKNKDQVSVFVGRRVFQ